MLPYEKHSLQTVSAHYISHAKHVLQHLKDPAFSGAYLYPLFPSVQLQQRDLVLPGPCVVCTIE